MAWGRRTSIYFPGVLCGSAGKVSAYNAGDLGLIPGLGRSPGEGKGYSLQYSSLENSMNCIVHGVANQKLESLSQDILLEAQQLRAPCLPHLPTLVLMLSLLRLNSQWSALCPSLHRRMSLLHNRPHWPTCPQVSFLGVTQNLSGLSMKVSAAHLVADFLECSAGA